MSVNTCASAGTGDARLLPVLRSTQRGAQMRPQTRSMLQGLGRKPQEANGHSRGHERQQLKVSYVSLPLSVAH